MRVYNTLTYNGVEKSFHDWGITSAERQVSNQAGDVFGFDADELYGKPVTFPWGAEITVKIQRSLSGSSYTGGTVHFVGYRMQSVASASTVMQAKQYKFASTWDFHLSRLVYRQLFGGAGTGAEPVYRSQVILGQASNGSRQTVDAQLSDIVDYARECMQAQYGGPKIQLGDTPDAGYIPLDAISNITCGEAIAKLTRWLGFGMCSVWLDYSTTPPTLKVVPRTGLTAVALSAPSTVKIMPREDLVPEAVHLEYRFPVTINGGTFTQIKHDIASPHGYVDSDGDVQGTTLDALKSDGKKIPAIVQNFDFEGSSFSQTSATIATATLDPTNLSWWQEKCPELETVQDLAIASDVNGISWNIKPAKSGEQFQNLPNELLGDGSAWCPWMNDIGHLQEVDVSAKFSGNVYGPNGDLISTWLAVEKHVKIKTTDLASGTYLSPASVTLGEPAPFGLAKFIWDIVSPLQYQGNIDIDEEMISNIIGVGNVLNLLGGDEAWETMRAQVQQVTYQYDIGRTSVSFGPADHLGAADMVEQLRCNRGPRWTYLMGTNRTNDPAAIQSIQTPNNQPIENSTGGGMDARALLGVVETFDPRVSGQSDKLFSAFLDALNHRFIMQGAPYQNESNPGLPVIKIPHDYITNPPAAASGAQGDEYRKRNMCVRELRVIADTQGTIKRSYILASEPVDYNDGKLAGGSGLFPFKLIPSPTTPAKGYDVAHPELGADPTAAWRAFRVRAGSIGRTNCAGTDGANADPSDSTVNPYAEYSDEAMDYEHPVDFVVPENLATFYVWLDTTATIPEVSWGQNPPTVDSGVDVWLCGKYILIATVDTQTKLVDHKAIVRQYVRGDILEYYKQAVCDNYNNTSVVALPGRKTT
jgi:hypothetical protein